MPAESTRSKPHQFAPRATTGSLPPGVGAEDVGRYYRHFRADLSPKKVLALLGIRAGLTGRAEQLRAALDEPLARRAISAPRADDFLLPAFHEAVYHWLLATPAGTRTHDSVIQPAQRLVDDRAFLDPARFAAAIAEHARQFTVAGESVESGSNAEALALFTLAFGLLQPEDAAALLAPVVALSPALAGWFGE